MKKSVNAILLLAGVCSAGLALGQQNSYYNRYDQDYRQDYRPSRRYEQSLDDRLDERREYNRRSDENRRYDNRYEEQMGRRYSAPMYTGHELSQAYDEGYEDGRRSVAVEERKEHKENYKNFTFGLYAGANSTRFEGEDVQGNKLSGRLGYQLGFFVRGGGRVYGQIGAEYLTSSSDFYQAGDGSTISDITSNVDQKYIHVPAYIGVKVAQSDRGISGVRIQIGAEYAAPLGVNNNAFNFSQSDFAAATVNGLANIGFDAGPLFLDFVYHYGFADVLNNVSNTKRRILGVNLGVKF
ncbi:hypothetical protein WBJ53_09510 [Spirosoma sp. SC4-14]|uniref:hypothetical protein n=1 Tax=Spirosoma sp. SC4-14 TaxID=3128900 RepID=UPI0030D1CA60